MSQFSQTCNLLSQYLKDNGGTFGDLSLGISCGFQDTTTTTIGVVSERVIPETGGGRSITGGGGGVNNKSMDLFPQQAGFAKDNEKGSNSVVGGQMTIFYDGKVLVFENFPADKAKEVMLLASTAAAAAAPEKEVDHHHLGLLIQKPNSVSNNNNNSSSSPPPIVTTTPTPILIQQSPPPPQPRPIVSDLPIARKASLARFLEKRKDRIIGARPYSSSSGNKVAIPPSKMGNGESRSWLGLQSTSVAFNNHLHTLL